MNKTRQADSGDMPEASAETSAADPMLPGTEQPRSLGDLMIEAERKSKAGAGEKPQAKKTASRRGRKPGRTQARRHARERALQALYQWDISDADSSTIKAEFLENQDMSRVDVNYFLELFTGISHRPAAVDDVIRPCLDRPLEDLDPIERAVLRIATFELTQQLDIPARVIINEGIEVTKRFGADKGHRYVNGVLDKLALEYRPVEMKRQ